MIGYVWGTPLTLVSTPDGPSATALYLGFSGLVSLAAVLNTIEAASPPLKA